jgi:hypothetical protein
MIIKIKCNNNIEYGIIKRGCGWVVLGDILNDKSAE